MPHARTCRRRRPGRGRGRGEPRRVGNRKGFTLHQLREFTSFLMREIP
jgi:hypothetical protein